MKIIVNRQHGGFSVSNEVLEAVAKKKNWFFQIVEDSKWHQRYALVSNKPLASVEEWNEAKENGIEVITTHCHAYRTDPDLISVIEEFGERANTWASGLEVVEIPDDVEWEVEEYDGKEWISEKHRTW